MTLIETEHVVRMRSAAVALAVALVVAIASGVMAAGGEVPAWEAEVFHRVNDLPQWLQPAMWVFQLAGLLSAPLAIALVAAVLRRWWLVVSLVALVPLKLIVEMGVVKQLVERERPASTICGAPDQFDTTCANFRDAPLEGLSFVSGHAIIGWSVAAVLWFELPGRWRWVPVAVAALNAIARVYLGAHNPLDVVGGAAVGVAIGSIVVIVVAAVRSAFFTEDPLPASAG